MEGGRTWVGCGLDGTHGPGVSERCDACVEMHHAWRGGLGGIQGRIRAGRDRRHKTAWSPGSSVCGKGWSDVCSMAHGWRGAFSLLGRGRMKEEVRRRFACVESLHAGFHSLRRFDLISDRLRDHVLKTLQC